MRVDLDAKLAAARAETTQDVHVLVFRGREFTLPTEAPFTVLEAVMRGSNETTQAFLAVRAILGEEYEMFLECRPTVAEATAFVGEAIGLWGLDLGESSASDGSSEATSTPSSPTSNGSTGSTSAKRSGGRKK